MHGGTEVRRGHHGRPNRAHSAAAETLARGGPSKCRALGLCMKQAGPCARQPQCHPSSDCGGPPRPANKSIPELCCLRCTSSAMEIGAANGLARRRSSSQLCNERLHLSAGPCHGKGRENQTTSQCDAEKRPSKMGLGRSPVHFRSRPSLTLLAHRPGATEHGRRYRLRTVFAVPRLKARENGDRMSKGKKKEKRKEKKIPRPHRGCWNLPSDNSMWH